MRCAELGRNPAQLLADYLAGGNAPSLPQAAGRFVIFTQSGREAILLAARLWGISAGDEVLIPAYHCGSEISPLIASGAKVSMYRIDASAQIDLSDVRRRITARTRLIHVIHYFGRPAHLSELAPLCRERNIKLLEDCALSLFSERTGDTGDGVIFSFYKTLPTCAGGALALRDPMSCRLKPPNPQQTARGALSLMKKWARGSLSSLPVPLRSSGHTGETADNAAPSIDELPAGYYCDPNSAIHSGPRITRGAVRRADIAQIVKARRANYDLLHHRLLHMNGASLLWEHRLEAGVCPLGLPILVGDKARWCRGLNAAGIPVSAWWSGRHRGLDWSEHPEALALKQHLILLPVHQNLTINNIDHIAHAVNALAASSA